jgi:hypothetical protein
MSSKRIGLAIDSLAGGGAEKIVLTLATELKRLGHEEINQSGRISPRDMCTI